jgi:hypothetical protein
VITAGKAEWLLIPPEHWAIPIWSGAEDAVEADIRSRPFYSRQSDPGAQCMSSTAEARGLVRTAYHRMCRYMSGFFWRHPALAEYDWFWRAHARRSAADGVLNGRAGGSTSIR